MRIVLIGLRPKVADILRSWFEPAGIAIEDRHAPAELIASRCQVAIVDCSQAGMAGRLARDAWTPSNAVAVLALVHDPSAGVAALQSGAHDFIVWPVEAAQAIARVRRLAAVQAGLPRQRRLELEGFVFDGAAQTVVVGDQHLRLTTKTYALAILFLRNIGRRLSRAEILKAVWGVRPDLNSRTLDAHVSQVRRVLALSTAHRLTLRSVYGHGYELVRDTSVGPAEGQGRPAPQSLGRPVGSGERQRPGGSGSARTSMLRNSTGWPSPCSET
ncbi:winged helix-turn-helix transcriptional regulator [Phenylobacterium sp. VNQ135]|uniref:winged helix-turn-helix transcriptional regulator n=1 Tax=Phenylobacterium sp. VNQ135 TaxID=3400922 RepID=UPI003C0B3987